MFHKCLLIILLSFLWTLLCISSVQADEIKQVTIVNPIRGADFWQEPFNILETPKKQYEVISKNNLPSTWLIRYDGFKDAEVINFLKSLDKNQEIGIFLEITPTFAEDSNVLYNLSPNWHFAKSVFLTGYSPQDRFKLIDTAFLGFKTIFGYYPKSVGAWWIDANSLSYMRQKYNIESNLVVSDQYSTDQYQVWGQYFSTPFYPSKLNALLPAGSADQKIGVVTIQWATRDPYNSFGSGVDDSTYSVQANDYLTHKLDIRYFEKLLKIYPQITVGLENDFSWEKYGKEYTKQIELLALNRNKGQIQPKTMSSFASFYKNLYPEISPRVVVSSADPLGSNGKVVWLMSPKYRAGWFHGPYGSVVRDLRLYNDSIKEECFDKACGELNLATSSTKTLDEVTYGVRWLIDDGVISEFKLSEDIDKVWISYKNQAGTIRTIKFYPNDIEVDGKIQPISFAILNAITVQQSLIEKGGIKEEDVRFSIDWINLFINFIKFLSLTALFFILPGIVLTRNILLSIPAGWVLLTLVSYLSRGQDIILWIIPIISLIVLIKFGLPKFQKPALTKSLVAGILLVLLGSSFWLLTTIKSGLPYNFGYGYFGPNGHDGVWHLSLIEELQRSFPPGNPVYAGERLTNYHYFFDLLLAKSGSLFSIDTQDLMFRFFPLLISVLTGLLMYSVAGKITGLKTAPLWAVFFLYFGGSFGWVVTFLKSGDLGGESLFWAQQSISTLLNPPYAISLTIFLAGLYIFYDHIAQKGHSKHHIFLLAMLWGSLIGFKAYAGILILGGLAVLTLEKIIFKKDFSLFPVLMSTLILSLVIFLPNNVGSGTLLVFAPLWFISSMIDFQDRLGWQRLSLAMHSGVFHKIILSNVLGIFIFVLGNFGTRILGLLGYKNIFHNRLLLYMSILGIILPMIFIQKGTNWNTIQFLYYAIFIFNIYAAYTVAYFLQRITPVLAVCLTIIIVVLTVPTTLNTLNQYLPNRPPAKLSYMEKEGLDFLRKEPSGTVLSLAFDPSTKNKYQEPLPLLAYTSTAYVSAYSNHQTFLEDTVNLDILGIDYKGRLNLLRDFAKIKDQAKQILKENNIGYVYIVKSLDFEEDEGRMGIKKIFENSEVKIFKVM